MFSTEFNLFGFDHLTLRALGRHVWHNDSQLNAMSGTRKLKMRMHTARFGRAGCFFVLAVWGFVVAVPPLWPLGLSNHFLVSLWNFARTFKNTLFSTWRVAAACHLGSGTSVCPLRWAWLRDDT